MIAKNMRNLLFIIPIREFHYVSMGGQDQNLFEKKGQFVAIRSVANRIHIR